MSKGAFAATAVDSVVLAADPYRAEVSFQHWTGDEVYLGFGEAGVVGVGIRISSGAAYIQITDHRARLAIHMICDAAKTAGGGYQTA